MEVSVDAKLNIMVAHGPFNKELVLAADQAQEQIDPHLESAQRWGSVLVFKGSALATPDAITAIADIVARRCAQGIRPVAIALVMADDVEGASLMAPHYLQAYARSSIPGAVFAEVQAASDWVLAQL
ncbi:MAG: hypothetical protein E6Q78_09360 [Rhodoferax sp.]|nr:MAG: hypothetical protein E6Q78_09360 [Rhodoferax sp.]